MITVGMVGFVFLVGLGLVFEDLGDMSLIGFRGDEDCWHIQ